MKKKMVSVPKRPGTIFVMRSGKEIYTYGKSDGKFDGCIGRRGRVL